MNWATSHLAEGTPKSCTKWKTYRQKGQDKEVTRKCGVFQAWLPSFEGMAGVSQADYVTGAEQVILDWPV